MQTGDVILVSGTKVLPKLIQWFQHLVYKSGWEWNHAGLILEIEGDFFVCESTANGIVLTPYIKFLSQKHIILTPRQPIPSAVQAEIVKFCLPYCGNVHYDYVNLFVEQPVKILSEKFLGREIWIGAKTDKKATRRFICGEWVAFVFNTFFRCFPDYPEAEPVELFNSEIFKLS